MKLIINEVHLAEGVSSLTALDKDLKELVEKDGMPPLWNREPGFMTLVHIILEQQVSLASAQAAFDRLVDVLDKPDPEQFLTLDDATLLKVGFSRQKTRYVRCLAELLTDGTLLLASLAEMDDNSARSELMQVTGIGAWTADIYLMMALGRTDIWPVGDLALIKSIMHVKRLSSKPEPETMTTIAESWRPWRSIAARVLWNHYLIHLNRRSVTN